MPACKLDAMARTQEERSATTRGALLDATIDCLVEFGYAGTTTTRVAERAGVTRGAQMHHFQRKAPLVVAALLRLAERRRRELVDRAERELPDDPDPGAALDIMWSVFSGPLFTAALELWIAARTDPELAEHLVPAEREIGRGARATARRFCGGEDVDLALELAANAMRGIALQQLLNPSAARRERQLDFLKQTISIHLTPERQTA
jgi:AcrR family transcriptional regulator